MVPRAAWIVGAGELAVIAWCRVPTISLHADLDSATAALAFIDAHACGSRCTRRHEIVRIDLDGQATMFRGRAPLTSCACGHVRRIHGPRPGLDDAGPGCRACHCAGFEATS